MRKWIAAALLSLVTVTQGVTFLEDIVVKDNTGTTNSILGITLKGVRVTQWPFLTSTPTNGLIYYDTNGTAQSVVFDGLTNVVLFYDGTNLTFAPGAGGGGDNLGNHVATMDLDMQGFNITNVSTLTVSNNTINIGDVQLTANSQTNLIVGSDRVVLLPELIDYGPQIVAVSNYSTGISNSLVTMVNNQSNALVTYVNSQDAGVSNYATSVSNSLVSHANTISNNLIGNLTYRFVANNGGTNVVAVDGGHTANTGTLNYVLGGTNNIIDNSLSSTPNNQNNDDKYNTIAGGSGNQISNMEDSFIGAGLDNTVASAGTGSGSRAGILAGNNNDIDGRATDAVIGGGMNNEINSSARQSGIMAGTGNDINDDDSFIGAGTGNAVDSEFSIIGSGVNNDIGLGDAR